jgi:hypothetical protein
MRRIGRCLIGVAVATPIFVAACGGDSSHISIKSRGRDKSNATFAARDTARKLGPGDILIANTDSSIELGLYGDSIVTGFGSKVLNEIRVKTDTGTVSGNGFAASIEKMVKSTVADAMSHQIKYAVADVQDVRFEDGKLLFFWKDGSRMRLFEDANQNKKPVSQTFNPDDAQRFVAAFKARKTGSHG